MSNAAMRNAATTMCTNAGDILLGYFGTAVKRHYKEQTPANVCSEADVAANSYITSLIAREFPDHGILSEEMPAVAENSEYLWVIDPLDGTNNFIHGVPHWSISIALLRNKQPILGVVYQPITKELFIAEKGEGATLNGDRIHCSQTSILSEALIGLGFYYDRGAGMRATLKAIEEYFSTNIHGVRRFGCASLDLAYVACGRFDAFFEFTLSPWDYAAGMLLVEESGGKATDIFGKPLTFTTSGVFAATSPLFESAHAVVARHAVAPGN
jgi:myo-inositol-1(or 4)-monophosphatase